MDSGQKLYEIQSQLKLIPGDHLCCFNKSEQEKNSLLYHYLRLGLEKGQKVLYISNEQTPEQVTNGLLETGLNPERYTAIGQLIIRSCKDLFHPDGCFDPEAVLASLQAEIDQATTEGYTALRLAADMSWAQLPIVGLEQLAEYERRLDLAHPERPFPDNVPIRPERF